MSHSLRYYIYISIIIIAITTSLLRYRKLDRASKTLSVLLIVTLLSETVAYYMAKYYRNNFPVYHFFAPVQLFIVGLYFNYSVEKFRKKNIGLYIGIAGIALAVLNSLYFQPLHTLNSYFLMYEGFCTVFMCLYAFNQMFLDDEYNMLSLPHFWFTFILLAFWSITYVNWGVHEVMRINMIDIMSITAQVLWIVNVLTYSGIAFVFLFYRKNIIQRE